MGIDMKNSEGYMDLVPYQALTNIEREDKATSKPAFRPLVYICAPFNGAVKENVLKATRFAEFAFNCGCESLVEKLMKAENFEMALDEIVWLITLLANQSVLIHNLQNKDDKKELLKEEDVELLTSPLELSTYKEAIIEAMFKGTKRYVESEETKLKNELVE